MSPALSAGAVPACGSFGAAADAADPFAVRPKLAMSPAVSSGSYGCIPAEQSDAALSSPAAAAAAAAVEPAAQEAVGGEAGSGSAERAWEMPAQTRHRDSPTMSDNPLALGGSSGDTPVAASPRRCLSHSPALRCGRVSVAACLHERLHCFIVSGACQACACCPAATAMQFATSSSTHPRECACCPPCLRCSAAACLRARSATTRCLRARPATPRRPPSTSRPSPAACQPVGWRLAASWTATCPAGELHAQPHGTCCRVADKDYICLSLLPAAPLLAGTPQSGATAGSGGTPASTGIKLAEKLHQGERAERAAARNATNLAAAWCTCQLCHTVQCACAI